ncbi:MAG TPA: cupin domain-containing protein, partial [Ramlibacter sp.]
MAQRPSFIVATRDVPESTHVYPQSDEPMGPTRGIGRAAGLQRIGINVQRLPPGSRSSWPHAESSEEEFVYVIDGEVDAWIDGAIHRMVAGDFAAFPAGTGISHCFINNGERDALL